MKLSRVARLIQLLNLLQSGRGYNSKDLSDICAISRRTIFRDLDVLKEAGVPVAFDEDQQRFFITGRRYLPPTSFTTEEALALMLLCHELGDGRGLPFFGSARSAALKIESSLPEVIREHLRKVTSSVEIQLDPRNPLAGSEATYQHMMDAIAGHRCVRILYDSVAEQNEICTKLSPYRMLFSRRSWYVIGRSSVHRGTRTFNVGRVKQLEVLDDRFKVPKGFSLARYLGNAWHMIPAPGRDRDVWIRFTPLVAQNVAEVVWHRTQRVAMRDDGSLDFHVRVSGIEEISWWVMGYGPQAEVIEPVELRELIAKNCLRLSRNYTRELAQLNGQALPAGAS